MNRSAATNRLQPLLIAIAIAVFVYFSASLVTACPTCANGMAGDSAQHQARIDGYFYSILLMMSMPFLLIGSFSVYMYLEVRKARAKQLREQEMTAQNAEAVEQPV